MWACQLAEEQSEVAAVLIEQSPACSRAMACSRSHRRRLSGVPVPAALGPVLSGNHAFTFLPDHPPAARRSGMRPLPWPPWAACFRPGSAAGEGRARAHALRSHMPAVTRAAKRQGPEAWPGWRAGSLAGRRRRAVGPGGKGGRLRAAGWLKVRSERALPCQRPAKQRRRWQEWSEWVDTRAALVPAASPPPTHQGLRGEPPCMRWWLPYEAGLLRGDGESAAK